jgi:hypothetical protein
MAVSKLYVEINAKNNLTPEMEKMLASLKELDLKATASGKALLGAFDSALNPSKRLGEQLSLLEKAGRSNAEIMAVYAEKVRAAGDATLKNGQSLDPVVKKYYDMAAASDKTGSGIAALGQTLTDFASNPLESAKGALTGFLEGLGPVGVGVAALGTAAVAAGVAVFKFVNDAAGEAEQLENLSAATGLSVQQLAALEQIAKEAGLESLDLGRVIGKLNENLGDTKPNEFTKAMERLGISAKDSSGQTKDAVKVLDEMRIALLAIDDPTQRAQLAQQALGGRLRDLIPLLLNSESGLADMTKEMIEQGVVVDDLTHSKLMAFDSTMDRLDRVWQEAKSSLTELAAAFVMWGREIVQGHDKLNAVGGALAGLIGGETGLKLYNTLVGNSAQKTRELTAEEQDLHNKMILNRGVMEATTEEHKKAVPAIDEHGKKVKELGTHYSSIKGSIDSALSIMESFWKKGLEDAQSYAAGLEGELAKNEAALKSAADAIGNLPVRWKLAKEELSSDPLQPGIFIPQETQDAVTGIAKDTGEKSRNAFIEQVSTIGTDLSKKLVDGLLSGQFSVVGAMKDIGAALLRAAVESFVDPLIKSLTDKLTKALTDAFNFNWGSTVTGGGGGGSVGIPGGGGGGGGGGGAGGAGGAFTGWASGLISGAMSIVGDVLGASIMRRDTKEIEVNTREMKIDVHTITTALLGTYLDILWSVREYTSHIDWIDSKAREANGLLASIRDGVWDTSAQIKLIDFSRGGGSIGESSRRTNSSRSGTVINGVEYYDAQGNPWQAGEESYWQTNGQWWRGDLGNNVTAISKAPWLDSGGYVEKSGLAVVHKGESVIPANSRSGITVNVYGPVYGLDDLDRKISDSITRTVRRGGLTVLTQGA